MNRNIYIEDVKVQDEFTGRKYFTVKLKSGFIGQGSSLAKAFDNANYVERKFLRDLMSKYGNEVLITVKCDDEKTPYIEIKGNTKETKDLNIKNISYSYFTGLEGMVVDFKKVAANRVLKERNITEKESGGKYAKELEGYLKRFPDIKVLEVVDNGDNVRCTLRDGRSAKSRKHPKDEFNIDLGVLWAYANAKNAKTYRTFNDVFEFLGLKGDTPKKEVLMFC